MVRRLQMTMTVNGTARTLVVEPRVTLIEALREACGLTGAKVGCAEGVCGACTVLVDAEPVRACLMFAVQAHGREVRTVEGLAPPGGPLHPLQESLRRHHAVQCGHCTAGVVMLAEGTFVRATAPGTTDIGALAAGTLCRCTGYRPILAALGEAEARLFDEAE
ncbi:(2Fe-2S)-binding protein [Acuticoccus sp.]|uniref:(2Fe-2S)-binding protein n=1 Tax=Acuticoccus sp. TaxID=1904378 RepID=UPI003B52D0FD